MVVPGRGVLDSTGRPEGELAAEVAATVSAKQIPRGRSPGGFAVETSWSYCCSWVATLLKIWEIIGPRKRRATITMIAMRARSRPYSTSV